MSTQVSHDTNIRALLHPSTEFLFSEGASSAADTLAKGFVHAGNVTGVTPNVTTQKLEHRSSKRGVNRKDREDVIQSQIEFKIKLDEFNKFNLMLMFAGKDLASSFTQSAQAAASADVLPFGTTAAILGNWYPILKGGVPVIKLTSVAIAGKTEGTDFEVDLELGLIRFKTAQSADLTPTITAPAITASDLSSFIAIQPGQTVKRSGIGKLVMFDQDTDNPQAIWAHGFSCQITLDSAGELNPNNWGDLTATVLITDTVGVIYGRKSLTNIT